MKLIFSFYVFLFPIALLSQPTFGDDTGSYALDSECDDPRFQGQGMAEVLVFSDLYRDASDCSSLFNAGHIALRSDIDFGDDTGPHALDSECDDPRFQGQGMAAVPQENSLGRDATDCRFLFNQERVNVAQQPLYSRGNLFFGDDTGSYALDSECDDPRFQGQGMAEVLVFSDLYRDASDCSSLFNAGHIALRSDIDFGDDTGPHALDSECDDPRFQGQGMAAVPQENSLGRDATDCRFLFNQIRITFRFLE